MYPSMLINLYPCHIYPATVLPSRKAQDRFPVKTPVTNRSGSVAASAFDENFLNQSQFIQLIEAFLGEEPTQEVIDTLVKYLKEGYVETEEEKFLRLQKVILSERICNFVQFLI